jgi:hypothetical protein
MASIERLAKGEAIATANTDCPRGCGPVHMTGRGNATDTEIRVEGNCPSGHLIYHVVTLPRGDG